MSWYLTITPLPDQPPAPTQPLIEFLLSIPALEQTGAMTFRNRAGQPWAQIVLAMGHSQGYSVDGRFHPQINVVEIICSYPDDSVWYDNLACRIAAFLGWVASEKHADRQIYPPTYE